MTRSTRSLLALLALILTPRLFAASNHTDVAVFAWFQQRAQAAAVQQVFVTVKNLGPDVSRNIVVRASGLPGASRAEGGTCRPSGEWACTIDLLRAGDDQQVAFSFETAHATGIFDIEVRVDGGADDIDLTNNHATGRMEIVRAPFIRLYFAGDIADPGATATYTAQIWNESEFDAEDVTFAIPMQEGWTFERSESDEMTCTMTSGELRCRVPRIAAKASIRPQFVLRAPASLEGAAFTVVRVTLTTKHGLFNTDEVFYWYTNAVFRHLVVSTTLDGGEGSLRHAIERANAACQTYDVAPCKVVFDISDAAGSVQTIRPVTPLPAMSAHTLTIDGSTQTARRGDTNPHGPEIEIDGSLLTAGDGLEVRSPWFVLRDVIVNNFPGNGIAVRATGTSRFIEGCYIGTDATGRKAAPNRSRGILIEIPSGEDAGLTIRNNVISGNARSGVFFASGRGLSVVGNRIGAGAGDALLPLGNGASGIFIGPGSWVSLIQKNVIAFNAHAGLSSAASAFYIAIYANSITANGGLGIDLGLDGVTPNQPNGYQETPNHPILTATRYDEQSGRTHVEGRIEGFYLPSASSVELFASTSRDSSGYGEGEFFLGRTSVNSTLRFSFDAPGDLRGAFITATLTVPNNYYPELPYMKTSEFSPAIRVEGEPSGPLEAQLPKGADLSLVLSQYPNPAIVAAGGDVYIYGVVANSGPETAENVVVDIDVNGSIRWTPSPGSSCVADGSRVRCTFGRMEPLASSSFSLSLKASLTPGPMNVGGVVRSETEDPFPANNSSSHEFIITATPLLETEVTSEAPVYPGATADYVVSVTHRSGIDADDVSVTIPLSAGWMLEQVAPGQWQCTTVQSSLVCSTPHLAAGSISVLRYTLRAPAGREGQPLNAHLIVTSSALGVLPWSSSYAVYGAHRVIPVTTTADAGTGSLRSAIETANLSCWYNVTCRVVFELPSTLAQDGVFTIRPMTPLPRFSADNVFVEGRSQSDFGGDTNPAGPEVEINGSLLQQGNGFEIASGGDSGVRGLTVNGFPGNGIHVVQGSHTFNTRRVIADNYIGTDPTGTRSVPNRLRGVVVDTGGNFITGADIVGNLISGNTRSAIFVAKGNDVRIVRNTIGLTAGEHPTPLGQGASGIFLGSVEVATVHENSIAYSAHAGVAIGRAAQWISVRGNSIFENGGLAIDYGLDLVTRNDDPDRPVGLPPFPELLTASYDAASGITRIEGTVMVTDGVGGIVELFANARPDPSGFGEAEVAIGEVSVDATNGAQRFVAEVRSDLRGMFITATWTRRVLSYPSSWTSEVSPAIAVPR